MNENSVCMSVRERNFSLLASGDIAELPKIPADANHCNGRNWQKTNYCKRPPGWGTQHRGTGRCKAHGGNSLRGIAHPGFKGRGYGKSLPSHIAVHYDEALRDENLLNLKSEIALCDARLGELTEQLGKGTGAQLANRLTRKYNQVNGSAVSSNAKVRAKFGQYLGELGDIIALISNNASIWDDMGVWIDRRQRLTEAEVRHMIHIRAMISAEEVMQLVGQLLRILRDRVYDRKVLAAIVDDIGLLLPSGEGTVNQDGAGRG